MIEVQGISTVWERHLRKVKASIIKALGYCPNFTFVMVSNDLAEEIQQSTGIIGLVGDNTTFEGTQLKVDSDLPSISVVYIWEDKNV
jgi:hypothetical protein